MKIGMLMGALFVEACMLTSCVGLPKGASDGKNYWSIDLQTGEQEYFASAPKDGWSDEFKTTKLLLRRIDPGTVVIGGVKPVSISRPYYIGVYEVTQKQYELIAGVNPSTFKGEMRPVGGVNYFDIRGSRRGARWPLDAEVDESGWLGRLRAKVGLAFDLPTESQWEYACRAGSTNCYCNNGSSDADLSAVARWVGNLNDGKGGFSECTTVGSYLPNAWGLYDMHGNIYEWCLDWYGKVDAQVEIDYRGPKFGDSRVLRGGYYGDRGPWLMSAHRSLRDPSTRFPYYGFRLVGCPAE